jgi:lipopolysaccharide export system permease protein
VRSFGPARGLLYGGADYPQHANQAILTLAMILLAVPFTFSAPRSPGMGSRLAVGVIVGLLTWISYQIMVNLGLLFALSAPVTALGLPVAFVLVALSLVYWYDRQH